MKDVIQNFFGSILNFLLPKTDLENQLAKVDISEFASKASESVSKNGKYFAFFPYRDPMVKKIIWQLKFKSEKKWANFIARLLYDHIMAVIEEKGIFEDFSQPILVPVPISRQRKARRGFNQTDLIADSLANLDKNANFEINKELLKKIIETKHQAELGARQERLHNLKNCFCIKNSGIVKGRNFIILDDVFTTGATFTEISDILQKAGAKKVIGVAFAH